MRSTTRIRSIGAIAAATIAFGATAATALDANVGAHADARIGAHAVMPVSVSSASVAVRPTTVGPVHHDGKFLETDPIAAGTRISVLATLHAEASGLGTASITTSDPARAVQVTEYDNDGQRCFGIGVDFVADVRVGVGANAFSATTAKAHGLVTVKVGDKTLFSWGTGDMALNGGKAIAPWGHAEHLPVVTGADVCLPAEVSAGLDAGVTAVTDVMGTVELS
ncbi:MAG TPA: hypothetical protein VFO65_13115 [Acidimicrobiales bacterium]|nr:hypothetical protein [Acidimicrobiales bacterium]